MLVPNLHIQAGGVRALDTPGRIIICADMPLMTENISDQLGITSYKQTISLNSQKEHPKLKST